MLQINDSELGLIIKYLDENELPTDKKVAKSVVAESPQFSLLDGVVHLDSSDSSGNARIAIPECLKESVLKEALGGCLAGYFTERKTFELLKRRYSTRTDARKHCRLCLVCASRDGPIPIGGPLTELA